MNRFTRLFCAHDDKIIDRAILPSPFDQSSDSKELDKNLIPVSLWPSWFFRRKFVLTFKCQRCGRVRTF